MIGTLATTFPHMKLTFLNGQELSLIEQIQYLEAATDLLAPIVEVMKNYKKTYAAISKCSFDTIVKYIKDRWVSQERRLQ